MNAMEKVAWTELIVSVAAVVVAAALIPWLGNGATSAFGLLGLLVCSLWFLRKRGPGVIVDERDREIERQATKFGVEAAWTATFLALIALVFWSSTYNESVVATRALTWLIWSQFAICYGVKGLVGVMSYRRQRYVA
jgi:hypothetical protein